MEKPIQQRKIMKIEEVYELTILMNKYKHYKKKYEGIKWYLDYMAPSGYVANVSLVLEVTDNEGGFQDCELEFDTNLDDRNRFYDIIKKQCSRWKKLMDDVQTTIEDSY